MEFHERLQELRKQKGLTQEELAQSLFVSRTAVSKWESGRGYPNIDSLKAIAAFFSVSIDELLSSGEALTLAEEDHRQRDKQMRGVLFGMLDCCACLFLFLPFFGEKDNGSIRAVSLLSLNGISPRLKTIYAAIVIAMIVTGILILLLQSARFARWQRIKIKLSLALNITGILLFILSPQPYTAALLFALLMIKVFLLLKKP